MATWRSENSMLTKVGVEILNKLKAGVGSITVTKIVAGSGRVAESQLYNQTKISGTNKVLAIDSSNVTEGGSDITVFITNEDFTAPFELHQIGVFVTHPDYTGEQLYHISQCDASGVDVIPTADATPVRLDYSLFLQHGNSSSISITINNLGSVSKEDFEAHKASNTADKNELMGLYTNLNTAYTNFKGGVREKKLITANVDGNLIVSGINSVAGTTSLAIKDAISHRALALTVKGYSTQATPSTTAPTYPVDSKVASIIDSSSSGAKTITFPSVVELRSLGDYKDTIEWDGAKWWKVQRIAEVVVDGTVVSFGRPAHSNSSAYSRGTIYTLDSASKVQTFNDALPSSPVITSHGNDSPSTSAKFYGFLETVSGTSQVRIQLHMLHTAIGLQAGQKDASARLNEILSWFKSQNDAGTPVKVRYVLNTPLVTEIPLTEVLEMYASHTAIACNTEGNNPSLELDYALNTTDDTTMYILKALARKSEVTTANTFATAEII